MPDVLRRYGLFLLAAAVLVFVYSLAAGGGFPLDDSWIHQTYGRNLAQYGEWAFLPGQPSAASTSPLYTVLLSIGYRLNLPFVLWTHFVGAAALALTAILGAKLAARFAPDIQYAPFFTGLALVLTWHLLWAAAAGMETMLAGMFPLLLIWLALPSEPDANATSRSAGLNGLIFGIAAAFATLTRPELVMLAGIVGLVMLLTRPQGLRGFLLWSTGAAVGFTVCIAPYLILNLQLTGGLLPNTAAAKFEQHAILLSLPYPQRMAELFIAIIAGGQTLLIPGMVFYAWQNLTPFGANEHAGAGFKPAPTTQKLSFELRGETTNRVLHPVFKLLPLIWAFALIALYAARLPAAYQHGRYVIPALPALVVAGVTGTLWLVKRSRYQMLPRILTRSLVGATLLLYGWFVIQGVLIYRVDVAIIDGEMVNAAHWIRDNLPPDELLAIHDIGAVGYFAPRPMLDIAGLVSPEIIPLVANPEALWALMQQRDARYLLAFPDQIPGRNPADPRLCPLYSTHAEITRQVGEPNMMVYRLAWDGQCEE